MEIKQIVMLTVLLGVAVIGSGVIVYILANLDKNDDDNNGTEDNGHGGH